MRGGTYMIRRIRSGKVIEESIFPVAPNVRPRGRRRRGATTARKQDANDRDAVKRLARTLNCNFEAGDLLIQPTYTDAALYQLSDGLQDGDLEELRLRAEHDLALFLRRLARELKPMGITLRAVSLTSDMDGDTGELVRVHHHVVLMGAGLRVEGGELYAGDKAVSAIWGRGNVDWKPLAHQDDYTPLAAYLLRQVRRRPDGKKYHVTRNLKKPELISERIVFRPMKLKAPKGSKILQDGNYEPGMPHYIRYVRPAKPERTGRRPQ